MTASGLARIDSSALVRLVVERHAALDPPLLRALDAIHLASALEVGDDLGAFLAYDRELVAAARALGLQTLSPGA